jgi:hypothetical protein
MISTTLKRYFSASSGINFAEKFEAVTTATQIRKILSAHQAKFE